MYVVINFDFFPNCNIVAGATFTNGREFFAALQIRQSTWVKCGIHEGICFIVQSKLCLYMTDGDDAVDDV